MNNASDSPDNRLAFDMTIFSILPAHQARIRAQLQSGRKTTPTVIA